MEVLQRVGLLRYKTGLVIIKGELLAIIEELQVISYVFLEK